VFKKVGETINGKEIDSVFKLKGVPSFEQFYNVGIYVWKHLYKGYYKAWHEVKAPTIKDGNATRRMETMNGAKAVCSEVASLIWAEKCKVEVTQNDFVPTDDIPDLLHEYVNSVLKDNNFYIKMRELIEQAEALGGGTIRVWYDIKKDENGNDIPNSGKIVLGYNMADQFIPLAWNNARITEGVFINRQAKDGWYFTTLEFHRWNGNEYVISNELYRKEIKGADTDDQGILGVRVPLDFLYKNLSENTTINGIQNSLFTYFKPSIANNIDDNSPLGISIYANALSTLKALDICYDSFIREFVLGKKRIIVPAKAMRYVTDANGNRVRYFDATDDAYVAFSTEDAEGLQIKDNTVELRVEEHEAAINAFLGILCLQIGLSPGTLVFNRAEGLKTATEVISEKSKTYKTIKTHQDLVAESITDTVNNIIAVAQLYDVEYKGVKIETLVKNGYNLNVTFDDSIIQDRQTNIDEGIKLVNAGLQSKYTFMVKTLGYTPEQAKAEIKLIANESNVNGDEVDELLSGLWGGG
jgi:A118 family predicted phage portal protein